MDPPGLILTLLLTVGTVFVVPQYTPVPVHNVDQHQTDNMTGNMSTCPLFDHKQEAVQTPAPLLRSQLQLTT